MINKKLCNDKVLADHPVGNLVIKKTEVFCYRNKIKLCNDKVLASPCGPPSR